jgi:hypothetical protein
MKVGSYPGGICSANKLIKIENARSMSVLRDLLMPLQKRCGWTLPMGDDDFSNQRNVIKIRFVRTIPW